MKKIGAEKMIAQSNGCSVYQFQNETGEGTITIYDVFPGVVLTYNDFHMSYYNSEYQPIGDVFCIDYCREGRTDKNA